MPKSIKPHIQSHMADCSSCGELTRRPENIPWYKVRCSNCRIQKYIYNINGERISPFKKNL